MSRFARVSMAMIALASSPAFAEDAAGASAGGMAQACKYLAAGIAIGLAVIGGTAGQGKAAAAAYEGIGRNPQAADKLFTPLLLGLALIEFQTIMAFIISILLVLN
jgi:F-type H+-transporting ATPase subunit c